MQGHLIGITGQLHYGGALGARQQIGDGIELVLGGVQHDVLALAGLLHPLDAGQQLVDELLLGLTQGVGGLHQHRLGAVDHLHLFEAVGFQGSASGDQIADGIGQSRAGGHFHRAAQHHTLEIETFLVEEALEQPGVGGGDALARQTLRPCVGDVFRHRQGEAAATEVELLEGLDLIGQILGGANELHLFQHVLAYDAKVDHPFHHQPRDVVITHPQYVDGHVFHVGDKALLAQVDLEAAALEQGLGVLAQATGFLHGDAQTLCFHCSISF
ncbi:hypothetical protein D3C72_1144700 [compost metagenome]